MIKPSIFRENDHANDHWLKLILAVENKFLINILLTSNFDYIIEDERGVVLKPTYWNKYPT